jgi:hypothetical protein
MPTLNWIGKEAVVNHHHQVPFHLLKDVPELSVSDPGSGNLIVQGDNLVALKACCLTTPGRSSASTLTRLTTPATKAGHTTTTSTARSSANGSAKPWARKPKTSPATTNGFA